MAYYRKVKAKNKKGYTWAFTIDRGVDPSTGKRKQITRRGFNTSKEAELAATKIMQELEDNEYVEENKITLKNYLTEWLEVFAKQNVRKSTFKGYTSAIYSRLIPKFGFIRIKEIKPPMLLKYYNELSEEGITPEYINYLHTILKHSLDTAVTWGYIKNNPVLKVSPPPRKRKQMDTWSVDECRFFLKYTKEHAKHHKYMLYFLAIFTGMRRGELLGLKWSDVNFENNTISVSRSLYYVPDEGIVTHEPKTLHSIRSISISDEVLNRLREYQTCQKEKMLLTGNHLSDSHFIISPSAGSPLNPNTVHKLFLYDIKKAGLKRIRFHDLRHTHATIMLKLGEHPKIVSERLGHTNIQTTMNKYSHVTPNMQKGSATRFEDAFKNDI
ncbi:site-specific integrase [Lentibacillus sp.]|uniref:site-specific integrase n=1 Tax=Lentibacillus sp. TaxID=1925746 RepID=UPI002B4B8154|nr:site-specific integrase [Lentibacillus sp.]HLS07741.1 site-specific integrase [Lentibacillus sp.]